jgi:hypothetical protein
MVTSISGYLVVLALPETTGALEKRRSVRYAGVDRIPAYPTKYSEEVVALDDYVFGGVKSDTDNVIPSFALAYSLWTKFTSSPRKFDVIFCCGSPEHLAADICSDKLMPLGYDVATIRGDAWSIIHDCPSGDWTNSYVDRLNKFALFDNAHDAMQYLNDYKLRGEADSDMNLEAIFVFRVMLD